MSTIPTRIALDEAEQSSPLQEGNRVLESIAQREALPALLAFTDLHERIRIRRMANSRALHRDLFETERFILDEVLQLICDRVQAITQVDGIVIALVEESADESSARIPELACRASAGPLALERGIRLISESEFLQGCLQSGRILRCDDCQLDARVELDFAHAIGARSTVLVPLRGRSEQLGVLQAFSMTPWTFSDHDIRCFDLFAELVLSALKPEDQDRRIHWLTGVASDVLLAKPAEQNSDIIGVVSVDGAGETANPSQELAPSPEFASLHAECPTPALMAHGEIGAAAPAETAGEAAAVEIPGTESAIDPVPSTLDSELATACLQVMAPAPQPAQDQTAQDEVLEVLAQTLAIPADDASDGSTEPSLVEERIAVDDWTTRSELPAFLAAPCLSVSSGSRPALNVMMGLVAVAALFSAGAWWGMQAHGKTAVSKTGIRSTLMGAAPRSVTTPAPPADVLSPAMSDTLMNTQQPDSESGPLTAIAEDKLAALPKITGVRHWSSSMASTVVIDMADNVPYEVHRLMAPERIYFDLHDTVLSPDLQGKTMDVGDALLTRVRVAQPVAGLTRVVLDTKDGSNFSVSMESNPYRLVVELRGNEKPLAARTVPSAISNWDSASANMTVSSPTQSLPARTLPTTALPTNVLPARGGKFRIVLDAGHGGWDLGTVGQQGLVEKDLVLDVTQRLGKLLASRLGSEVVFTRTNDTYLPLEQRADIANQAQADLFVSIHANYSSSASARGVETYYTNLFSAPGSREVEKHDDGTFTQPTPVSLSAEGLHEKIEESQRLANSVQRSLYATLAAGSPDIRNRGIKSSAFAVLTGTTMPAILTEISFVSSPADEHKLQSAAYRQQIAEALYQGIARYQQSSPRTRVAQLQKPIAR